MVPVSNNRGATTSIQTANLAVVAQSFDWDDQIHALNISEPKTAHLAQINDNEEREAEMDPKEETMALQFAFMVQSIPEPANPEFSENIFSKSCIIPSNFCVIKLKL